MNDNKTSLLIWFGIGVGYILVGLGVGLILVSIVR